MLTSNIIYGVPLSIDFRKRSLCLLGVAWVGLKWIRVGKSGSEWVRVGKSGSEWVRVGQSTV